MQLSREVFCEEKVSTEGILLPLTPFVPVLIVFAPKLYLDCKYSSILILLLTNLCQKGLENYKWIASTLRAQHILINEAVGRRPQAAGCRPQAVGRRPWAEGHTPKATGQRHCIKIGGLSAQFWEKNLRAVHSLPLFAKADSDHHVCLDGVAISTIVVAGARGGRI